MTDRHLGAPDGWGESFSVSDSDIELINNLLLEAGVPLTSEAMAEAVVRDHLQREARRRANISAAQKIYQPKQRYQPGDELAFPALGFSRGRVTGLRPGRNPELGTFDVIQVEMDGAPREFAAGLLGHKLNDVSLETLANPHSLTAEEVMRDHGASIAEALEARLRHTGEIVRIAGRWFPRALLADISPGHLNLAEAVLDVAGGGPLPTHALLEHVELPKNIDPRLGAFSLEYALQEDERFDEVGPAGQTLWFLRRLEPTEVVFPPRRLAYEAVEYDPSRLIEPLRRLERQLEDEWGPAVDPVEGETEVSLTLSYPHWRVGALPLTSRLARLFPTAYEAPRIRFEFVDAENGSRVPGWVVRPQRYVYGLAEWYAAKGLIAGAYVRVRQGEKSGEVLIEAGTRRPVREWVRTAAVASGGRLTFSMQKQLIGVEYDELMVISVADVNAVDEVWLRSGETRTSLPRLVAEIFREVAKLNPQSTVHAQTLYSAVNVARRLAPGPILSELAIRPYYVHVGDLYFRFDESRWVDAK